MLLPAGIENKAKFKVSSLKNSEMSSLNEPLNLLRDFKYQDLQAEALVNYQPVTERQLVLDCIQLL